MKLPAKLLVFSVILTAISFCLLKFAGPFFSVVIQLIICIVFGYAVGKIFKTSINASSKLFALWFLMIILAMIIALLAPHYAVSKSLSDVKEITVPFIVCISSYYVFRVTSFELKRWLLLISIIGGICAILVILTTGGFEIVNAYREGVSKNQTAPFFAYIGLITLISLLFEQNDNKIKWILFAVFIVCMGFAVINRARTTFLSSLLIVLILLFIKYRTHSLFLLPAIMLFVSLFLGDVVNTIIQDSIIGQQDIHDANSITSGRAERNAVALEFIKNHPLFGAFEEGPDCYAIWQDQYKVPHNFVLWKLTKYGIVLSFPYLVTYIAIALVILKLLRGNLKDNVIVMSGFFLAYATSLSEYSAPFGPGTSFILFYIILGRTLYMQNRQCHKVHLT